MDKRYQLRYAAGLYWLLFMEQTGDTYHKPLALNEAGAGIVRGLMGGMKKDELIRQLCGEYGISREEAARDMETFEKQLSMHGIRL